MKIEIGEDGKRIRVEWETEAAREVGYELISAGTAADGTIKDTGFWNDGHALVKAADHADGVDETTNADG